MSDQNEKPDVQSEVEEESTTHIQVVTPVVVELGKVKRKKVKALKKGKGKLMDDVLDVLDEVADHLGEEAEGKTFLPIIMIYEKKPKKRKRTIVLPF